MPDEHSAKPPKMRSFVQADKIEQDVKQQREKERSEAEAEEKRKKQEEAAAEAEASEAQKTPEQREREREDALDREGMFCAELGKRVLPSELMDRFKDLRDAIRDKRFLLSGYATITREIWGQPIVIKTPTQREYAAIQALSEAQRNAVTGAASYSLSENARWLIIFLVRKWGEEEFPVPKAPHFLDAHRFEDEKEAEIKKFVESEQVQKKLEFFENLPMPVYERLAALCIDTSAVLFVALREDAENP